MAVGRSPLRETADYNILPQKIVKNPWVELGQIWPKNSAKVKKATKPISYNRAKLLTFFWWFWFCFVRLFSPGSIPGRGIR
jgi:hypothetical protein